MPVASSVESKKETAACGPGCNCGTPSGSGKRMKAAVSLIVVLAVVGIFAYKASVAKGNASNNVAAKNDAGFAVTPAAPNAKPVVAAQASSVAEPSKTTKSAVPENKPTAKNAATPAVVQLAPEPPKASPKMGEYLESLAALNKVALNQDGVFIFIPAKNDEPVSSKTNDAVLAAQKALKTNKITLGLYTLAVNSSDYSAISKQVQPPAVLVAMKGKGMAAVSGDVTDSKLLQTFVSLSSAGGCGPSGCGPASAGCK